MAALTAELGPAQARAWFTDVKLEQEEGLWVLLAPTSFKAEWIAPSSTRASPGRRKAPDCRHPP